MAKPFVLIARDQLKGLMEKSKEEKTKNVETSLPHIQPIILEGSSEEVKKNVAELVELLPKTYKNRAKSLLKFLEPYLSIDSSNQLVFTYKTQVFSALWDLIFFLFTNENFGRTTRPLEATDFLSALIDLKIPQRLLSTKQRYVKKIMRQNASAKKKLVR